MSIPRRTLTLALSLLVVLAACRRLTDPGVGVAPGTFDLGVFGDTTFALSGHAGYRGPLMVLTTQSTPQQADFFQVFVGVPADPGERRHPVRYEVMPLGGGTVNIVRQGAIRRQFAITGGTLHVERVTADHVGGSGELTAEEVAPHGQPIPGTGITLDVVFDATRARL